MKCVFKFGLFKSRVSSSFKLEFVENIIRADPAQLARARLLNFLMYNSNKV
jgi:hypothetical protein